MEGKCPVCGAPLENGSCSYCGYVEKKATEENSNANNNFQQPVQPQNAQPQVIINYPQMTNMGVAPGISKKSKTVALLLCIFLGGIGAHKFYVGRFGMGVLYLFTIGLFGIGWLIDIILILTGNFKDKFGLPLRQ